MAPLPVEAALPALAAALRVGPNAVLQAPPGAGKTTRVPLALLHEPWATGRLLMLEPRRLAARGAAARMAETLGQAPGATVGHRIRGEDRTAPDTRIVVATEGVLTRMLQADPGLDGVSAVIFDEIHERSIHADLGLALCLEAQAALRPDLRLLAMSATLDAGPVAALMGGAPVVTAEGRAFPVETRWADRPRGDRPLADAVADAVRAGLAAAPGDALVFLPGAREIAAAAAALRDRLPPGVDLRTLTGAQPLAAQRAALADCPPGRRKVVLSTAVAETSLTVPGVRVVVDAGLARRARFDPGSGMSRLVTERASRAEADQRRGRAGRTAPGLCLRLWTKGEAGAMPAFAPPEIAVADLAPLALELAAWGARDPAALPFLDPPPEAAFAEARALLRDLGALDGGGAITAHGRAMAALPLHPRLAHMALACDPADAPTARALAALLAEGDPLRGSGEDVATRLAALADPRAHPAADRAALARAAGTARRLGPRGRIDRGAAGRLLALAYPDRVAQRRPGEAPRHRLTNGKGAALPATSALAAAPLLAVAETDGDPREARIRLAAPLSGAELETLAADRIATADVIGWDPRARAVVARRERRLGALTLDSRPLHDADPAAVAAAMLEGLRAMGLAALPWDGAARRLRARLAWAHAQAPGDWPAVDDAALLDAAQDWLGPWLAGVRRAADLAALPVAEALRGWLGRDALRRLDAAAPDGFETPAGERARIDYDRAQPTARVRPQALYGLDRHPAPGVTLELLSPADRPIATTADLPGFWRGGWLDARRDMRGRYPRHDWPERPWTARPATRPRAR